MGRIGRHLYRLRTLYRNVHGRWRRVRSYWHLWRRNHYNLLQQKDQDVSRTSRRTVFQEEEMPQEGFLQLKDREDSRTVSRSLHRLHGRTQWRWGRFRRIGRHLYRLRTLYRNVHGRWRRVRSYWHLWRRNHYNLLQQKDQDVSRTSRRTVFQEEEMPQEGFLQLKDRKDSRTVSRSLHRL